MFRTHSRVVAATFASTLGSISLITGIYGTTMLVKTVSAVSGLGSIGASLALVPSETGATTDDSLNAAERGISRERDEQLQSTTTQISSLGQIADSDTASNFSMVTASEEIVVSTAHAIGIHSSTRPTLRRGPSQLNPASTTPTLAQSMPLYSSSSPPLRHSRMFSTPGVNLTLARLQASIPSTILEQGDAFKTSLPNTNEQLKCLLVENNLISIKILERLLSRIGCACALAYDGAEAIVAALGGSKFDLILMDLSMPKVDGETAAKYIRRIPNCNQATPIIAVSAYDMSESELSDSVFDASLPKPVRRDSLSALLTRLGYQVEWSSTPQLKNSRP